MDRKVEEAKRAVEETRAMRRGIFEEMCKKDPTLKILGFEQWMKNRSREKTIQDLEKEQEKLQKEGTFCWIQL